MYYRISPEQAMQNDRIYDPCWEQVREHMLSVCENSDNMIVIIFDVKEKKFLGCSPSINKILGYRPKDFITKDWNYWFSKIDAREVKEIKSRIYGFLYNSRTINESAIFLKYHIGSNKGFWCFIKHELELRIFEKNIIALNYICDYSGEEKIKNCFATKFTNKASRILHRLNISAREMDVLYLIADGLSSKEIGNKLFISYNTVISHRKHLLQKFRVQNSAQLIKSASQLYRL
ncbi:response regulator transcription factor [Autumnicola psychrophila]|uniref:Helix-turn-helix transcriptional regulator n=1 Tax=Autumnicola psychrophila TaxID=3075592 RepID=A0ABU3DTH7_9FLAO|nr:helix-turn-helix transcriptional regulator [Zunongwangia sp. F225]MDT0686995.1 helix-turn-helix transcriptional regulator [Zunongwangia sp. F225]